MQTGFDQWTKCHYHRLKLKATRTEQDSNSNLSTQELGDMRNHLLYIWPKFLIVIWHSIQCKQWTIGDGDCCSCMSNVSNCI